MRYFDRTLTLTQFMRGLSIALVGLTSFVPFLFVIVFLPLGAPIRKGYLLGCLAVIGLVLALVIFQVLWLRSKQEFFLHPWVTFALISLITIAGALCNIAAGGHNEIFLPLFGLIALYIGIVGDLSFQISGLVLVAGAVSAVLWENGDHHLFVSHLVVEVTVLAALEAMVARLVGDLQWRIHVAQALKEVTDPMENSHSVDAAVECSVDTLRSLMALERVVLLYLGEPEGRIGFTWPNPQSGDARMISTPACLEAVASTEPVADGSLFYVPAGFIEAGEVVMVLQLQKGSWRKRMGAEEVARALVPILLRITGRLSYEALLEQQSRTDALTGLANRRVLNERLEAETVRAQRLRAPLCVAMIDLDNFKEYNDAFGHVEGDAALQSVAASMLQRLRAQDFLARYGGEEFCLALPDTDEAGGQRVLDELRQAISNVPLAARVSISAGVASWDNEETVAELIQRADRALYVAKQRGRDQVVVATSIDQV